MTKRRSRAKVSPRARRRGASDRIGFTPREQEIIEVGSLPPYKTYREIAEILTKTHPRDRVTEAAVKNAMSRAGYRALRANSYQKKWYAFAGLRRRLRRGIQDE
ncbi:MAG TPA: hypothetical protein VGS11_10965 [Candidatus Bathyarchaeia archaeon]|nr:hypothetical protein [Candidatus Bathyarchaeia archaeon]